MRSAAFRRVPRGETTCCSLVGLDPSTHVRVPFGGSRRVPGEGIADGHIERAVPESVRDGLCDADLQECAVLIVQWNPDRLLILA